MPPLFETIRSFKDVPITNDGIDTLCFLDAADGLALIFDLFGRGVFGFIQSDIRGNIEGVRKRFEAEPNTASTLEQLAKSDPDGQQGAAHLLRLLRGVELARQALRNSIDNPDEHLHVSFRKAYDSVLKRHHGFAVRTVVYIAIRAVPRRADFYSRIAQGGSQEALMGQLREWLDSLEAIVTRMNQFYASSGKQTV